MARKVDPKEQFSKKMASRTEWFWFAYMIILAVAIVFAPTAALPYVYLGIMVTLVMLLSVWMYTRNSISEKGFFWAVELAKAVNGKKDKSDEEPEEDPEGESNG